MPHSSKASNSAFDVLRQAGAGGLFGLGEKRLSVLLHQAVQRPTFVCPPSGGGPLVTTALGDGLYTGHTEGVLNMREGKVTRLRTRLATQGLAVPAQAEAPAAAHF